MGHQQARLALDLWRSRLPFASHFLPSKDKGLRSPVDTHSAILDIGPEYLLNIVQQRGTRMRMVEPLVNILLGNPA